MDRQKLNILLQRPEGTKLDFKAQLSLKTDTDKKELAKDVTAIANSKGGRGYIIFGIEDKTKRIIGIEDRKYTEEQIQQVISQRCDPPVSVKLDSISSDNKVVGVLTIYKSNQRPHQIRQNGAFYIRRGSTTDIARREEIAGMLQETGMLQYEKTMLNQVDIKELDESMINDYISKTGLTSSNEDYFTLLEGIGIVGREEDSARFHPTIGGLLVFGRHPQQYLPHAGVRIINHFSGKQDVYFSGPITVMLDTIEEYLTNLILPANRQYPMGGLVEAICNATVHRDYFAMGREIVIFIERNKVEVSNPGAICGEDEVISIFEEHNPCRRNQWLYQRLLILDNKKRFLKSGIGLKRIQEAFKHMGDVHIVNNEKRNLFKVILPGPV